MRLIWLTIIFAALGMAHATGPCETGWTYGPMSKKCYLVSDRLSTCHRAEDQCLRHGAHLVSIDDETENTFLVSLILTTERVDQVWTGLYRNYTGRSLRGEPRAQREAGWWWLDGSRSRYRNWLTAGDSDEPSGFETEICVRLLESGRWADGGFNQNFFYICEKEVMHITTTSTTASPTAAITPAPQVVSAVNQEAIYISLGVIGLIALVVVVAFFILKTRNRSKPLTTGILRPSRLRRPTAKRISKYDISGPSDEPVYDTAMDVDMAAYEELPLEGKYRPLSPHSGASQVEDDGVYANYCVGEVTVPNAVMKGQIQPGGYFQDNLEDTCNMSKQCTETPEKTRHNNIYEEYV